MIPALRALKWDNFRASKPPRAVTGVDLAHRARREETRERNERQREAEAEAS